MPHPEVVRAIRHAAIRIAAAADEVAAALGSRDEHTRTVEVFCNQGLRRLRAEVAKKDDKRIAGGRFDVGNGFEHVSLIFAHDGAFIDAAGLDNICMAHFGQGVREAVTGNGNDAEFYLRNILKFSYPVHNSLLVTFRKYRF